MRKTGRSSTVEEVIRFMDYWDICVMFGSNPHTAKKLGRMKPELRNINDFTCLVSTVDIGTVQI